MNNWYIISRVGIDDRAFYPIYVISKYMDAKYINYSEANNIDFTGKNVILHCVWKKNQYNTWKTLPEKLSKQAKNFWIEFDADSHLDSLYLLDGPKNTSRFFYKIFEPCKQFIWEQPMFYNPFSRDIERIQLRCYHQEFEKPISAIKDIDFFTCVDTNKNVLEIIEVFTELKKRGYSICFMILNESLYNFYKNKLDFPIITNTEKFTRGSIERFESLMARSKVYVDLSPRLTTGRVVYDAAFRGTFFVGTDTYGATNVLFPEFSLTPYPINMQKVIDKCILAREGWNKESVLAKREEFRKQANVNIFIKELEERSK